MKRHVITLFVVVAFLLGGVNTLAADGALDSTFNGTGKAVVNVGASPSSGYFSDVVVIGGNKFLVSGSVLLSGDTYFGITLRRFNADGSLDMSFGSGGTVLTDLGVTAFGG